MESEWGKIQGKYEQIEPQEGGMKDCLVQASKLEENRRLITKTMYIPEAAPLADWVEGGSEVVEADCSCLEPAGAIEAELLLRSPRSAITTSSLLRATLPCLIMLFTLRIISSRTVQTCEILSLQELSTSLNTSRIAENLEAAGVVPRLSQMAPVDLVDRSKHFPEHVLDTRLWQNCCLL